MMAFWFEISVIGLLVIGLGLQLLIDTRLGVNPHHLQKELDKAERHRNHIGDLLIERLEETESRLNEGIDRLNP